MQPLVLPEELKHIYAQPGPLSGQVATRARHLYSDTLDRFEPGMLSDLGKFVYIGDLSCVMQTYEHDHPNLNSTETALQLGYISLAVYGSQSILFSTPDLNMEHAKVIEYLILNGAAVDIPDVSGSTVLHLPVVHNCTTELLRAIFTGRPDPNARDRYGATPLLYAVMKGRAEVVEMCLSNGGDLEVADGDGITPSSRLRTASPTVVAIVGNYKMQRGDINKTLESKERCLVCGKQGKLLKCARCHIPKYCGRECQRTHWKNGHKATCLPLNDEDAIITLRTWRAPYHTLISLQHGFSDGGGMQREGEPNPGNGSRKMTIIKVQLALGTSKEMLVYDEAREITCQIKPDGQQPAYGRLEKKIRESGLMGLKGYFMVEVGENSLKIKVADILANQHW